MGEHHALRVEGQKLAKTLGVEPAPPKTDPLAPYAASEMKQETMMKGIAEYHAGAAHQTYRMLDDFIQDAFNKKL